MKRPIVLAVGALCCMLSFELHAQPLSQAPKLLPEKPSLFNKIPQQFTVSAIVIDELFGTPIGGTVKIPFSPGKYFEGTVTDNVRKNAHVVTVNVRSSNYEGAFLSLSKITRDDLSVQYLGRIISIRYGDLFLIDQQDNAIRFTRNKQSAVITE